MEVIFVGSKQGFAVIPAVVDVVVMAVLEWFHLYIFKDLPGFENLAGLTGVSISHASSYTASTQYPFVVEG